MKIPYLVSVSYLYNTAHTYYKINVVLQEVESGNFRNILQQFQKVYLGHVCPLDGIVQVFEVHFFQRKNLEIFADHFEHLRGQNEGKVGIFKEGNRWQIKVKVI